MTEFLSEQIKPAGGFDMASMARGEPGLPDAFEWRGETCRIEQILETWKESSTEGGVAGRDLYLRRHCYRLGMLDGSVWTIYFTRQSPRSGSAKSRWFLYTRTPPADCNAR